MTTILGATKNQDFIKKWKAKVGEQEADRIKNHSSNRGTAMHKFLEHYVLGTNIIDLTRIGQEARPMADKIIEVGLAPVDEYYGSEVYGYRLPVGGSTRAATDLYVHTMVWRLLLTSNKVTVRRGKNGLKIITCKLQHTPWPTTM